MQTRDYSLMGKDGAHAIETGLANARWYATDIPRKEMKELMKRSDGPAIRDTLIWLAALIGFASIAIALWPSWWSAPFWLAYGVLYGSSTDRFTGSGTRPLRSLRATAARVPTRRC